MDDAYQAKEANEEDEEAERTVYTNNYKKNDVTFMDIVQSHHFIIPLGLSRVTEFGS